MLNVKRCCFSGCSGWTKHSASSSHSQSCDYNPWQSECIMKMELKLFIHLNPAVVWQSMNRTLLDYSLWGDWQRQPLSSPCGPLYQSTLPCLSVCCCSSQHLHINQTSALLQVSDFPEEQLLVAVFPGVPTAAELFLLPHKNQSEGKKKSEEELEQVWATAITVCWNPVSVWRRGDCQRLQMWTAMLFVFNRFLTSLLARWIKIWWSSSSSLALGWSCTTHSWHWVRIVCSQSQLIPPQTFLFPILRRNLLQQPCLYMDHCLKFLSLGETTQGSMGRVWF